MKNVFLDNYFYLILLVLVIFRIIFFIKRYGKIVLTESQERTISKESGISLKKLKLKTIPIVSISNRVAKVMRNLSSESKASKKQVEEYKSENGIRIENIKIGGILGIIITPNKIDAKKEDLIALYVHGGGFVVGNSDNLDGLKAAKEIGIKTYSIDYSLSPEAKFPIAMNETLTAYKELERKYGHEKIVLIGSSAGGNLILTSMLKAKADGVKLPKAIVLNSPWTDLEGLGDSNISNGGRDPLFNWNNLGEKMVVAYTNKLENPKNPLISPVNADFSGFPPTLLLTGTRDVLLSDSVRTYWKMKKDNVVVDMKIWEGMWHAFQLEKTPEAKEFYSEVNDFVNNVS